MIAVPVDPSTEPAAAHHIQQAAQAAAAAEAARQAREAVVQKGDRK
ncbi:hypothetical protein [Streptomyces luteireticuli]